MLNNKCGEGVFYVRKRQSGQYLSAFAQTVDRTALLKLLTDQKPVLNHCDRGGIAKFVSLAAILAVSLSSSLNAGSVGSTGGQFLKLGVGARAVALGESFVAVADDASSVFWNPAGLARLTSKELSASHSTYVQDVNYESISYAHPLKKGAIGAGANYLYMGGIERRGKDESLQGSFGASDFNFSLSYASPLIRNPKMATESARRILGGVTIKMVRQQIDSFSANAVAMDLGLITPVRNTRFTFGIAVQNLGSDIKFQDQSYPLPRTFRMGLSWLAPKAPVMVTGGLSLPRDNSLSYQLGAEYWPVQSFALRSGYTLRPSDDFAGYRGIGTKSENTLTALSGFVAGMGIKAFNMQLDYAFVPMGDLGSTHRVTLGMRFK